MVLGLVSSKPKDALQTIKDCGGAGCITLAKTVDTPTCSSKWNTPTKLGLRGRHLLFLLESLPKILRINLVQNFLDRLWASISQAPGGPRTRASIYREHGLSNYVTPGPAQPLKIG